MSQASWDNLRLEIRDRGLGYHPIAGFAVLAGAQWPKARAAETFDEYLDDDVYALQRRDGLGVGKIEQLHRAAAHLVANRGRLRRDGRDLACAELSDLVEECGTISSVVAQVDWDAWIARCDPHASLATETLRSLHRRLGIEPPPTPASLPRLITEIDALPGWGAKKLGLIAGTVAAMAGVMSPLPKAALHDGLEKLTSEDALRKLADRLVERQLVTGHRLTETVSCYYGCGDLPHPTLREVGKRVSVTHERVRQIVEEFREVCRGLGVAAGSCLSRIPKNGVLTSVDRQLVLGKQSLRGHARMLADLGLDVGCFEVVASNGKVRSAGASARGDSCWIAAVEDVGWIKEAVTLVMDAMSLRGLMPVADMEAIVGARWQSVLSLLRTLPGSHEVHCDGGPVWWLTGRRNAIYTRAYAVLSSLGEVTIADLADSVSRSIHKTLGKSDRRDYPTSEQVEVWLRTEKACDSDAGGISALAAVEGPLRAAVNDGDSDMLAVARQLDYPQSYRDLFDALDDGLGKKGRDYSKPALDSFVFKSPYFVTRGDRPDTQYYLLGSASKEAGTPTKSSCDEIWTVVGEESLGNAEITTSEQSRRSERAKEIGDCGERAVLAWLREHVVPEQADTIVHEAGQGLTPGYDISYRRDGEVIGVEVKATDADSFSFLEISANEWRAAVQLGPRYRLALVARATTAPVIRIIDDPAAKVDAADIDKEPIMFRLVRRSGEW